MSTKVLSCSECRKQHRKCVKTKDTDSCERCNRLHLTCVIPTRGAADDFNEAIDGSKQLKKMRTTVDLLQHTIKQLESELYEFKQQNQNSNNYKKIEKFNNPIFHHHQQQQHYQQDVILSQPSYPLLPASLDRSVYLENNICIVHSPESACDDSSSSSNSTHDGLEDCRMDEDPIVTCNNNSNNNQIVAYQPNQQQQQQNNNNNNNNNLFILPKGKEWKISIVNGKWRIETGIQTVAELDSLYKIIYGSISPFHINNKTFLVESCDPRSILPFTIKIARSNLLCQTTQREQQQQLLSHSIPDIILSMDPVEVVNQLVYRYFALYNPTMTFLYEPTFMAHYQQLKNPFTCPITMAICTLVCCAHTVPTIQRSVIDSELIHNPPWFLDMFYRRSLGEFYYRQCRNVLDEIIHEPKRQLETLITITLLKRFLMNTLRVSEMRNLETLAYFLCLEIKPQYEDPHTCTIVERSLFARHYSFTIWCYVMVDFFSADCKTCHEPCDFMYMDVLPGESETTRQFFRVQNYYLEIFFHPTVQYAFQYIRKILMGNSAEMSLELIVSFEDITINWWKRLPDDLRLCDDPYNLEKVTKAISETNDNNKLTLFLFFLDLIFCFHSCLQKIKTLEDQSQHNSIIALIQQKSIKACLDYSELLILAVNRMDPDVAYAQYLSDIYLFITVDVLAALAFSNDVAVATKAKQKLKNCLMALETADFMEGQRIPKYLSPLYNSTPISSKTSFFKLYHDYPQPRYALLYDICRYLAPVN